MERGRWNSWRAAPWNPSYTALWLETELEMVSADSDFARFTEIVWLNPVKA